MFFKSALLISISLFLLACSSSTDSNNTTTDPNERSDAADFSLQSLDHGMQSLSQYEGKVVYLFFLGFNCPPCISHAPGIESKIVQKYSSDQVQVLGLDVWDGGNGGLQNFKIQTGVSFPLLVNAGSVGNLYNAFNDYSVVVDKQGRIAYRKGGADFSAITSTIDDLLEE